MEAISWALNDAPDVPSQAVAVLFGLANHARPDGTGAFASHATLARYARKDERNVRKDIKALVAAGVIRVSPNQDAAAYIRKDRRPVVYDLAMSGQEAPTGGRTRPDVSVPPSDSGGTHTTGRQRPPGRTRPDVDVRGDAHDRTSAPDEPTTQLVTSGEEVALVEGSAARKRAANPRGTRLPADWEPGQDLRDWFNADPQLRALGRTFGSRETEKFRDYWHARSGSGALKCDWNATWRSWMRKAAGDGGHTNRTPGANGATRPATTTLRMTQADDALAELKADLAGRNPQHPALGGTA